MRQVFTIVDNGKVREMTEAEIEFYSSLEEGESEYMDDTVPLGIVPFSE